MNMFTDFINEYGTTILQAIITAIAGYVGIVVKKYYTKYINDKTKKSVVNTCVKAVEQLYKDLHGEDKVNKCIESVSEILAAKGITISSIEIQMMIESAVKEMNDSFDAH